MGGAILCAAVLTVAVDVGWRPRPDGGMEYIVQIDPRTADTLRTVDFASDLPPNVRDVRGIRIRMGSGAVERTAPPAGHDPSSAASRGAVPFSSLPRFGPFAETPPRAVSPPADSRPLAEQRAVYEKLDATQPARSPSDALKAATAPPTPASDSRSWLLAVLGLVSLSAAALYLLWVAWDYRARYQKLVRQLVDLGQMPVTLAAE